MSELNIIVDNREMRSNITRELFDLGIKIESENLEVGDYILSNDVCVERKTVKDFLSSLTDGRLFTQAENLIDNFQKPIIVIEGEEDIYSLRDIHPNAIKGALASLVIDFEIPVLNTKNQKETASILRVIAKREQEEREKSVKIRGEKSPLTDKGLKKYVVCGLPGIGPNIAENLLEHFGSIKDVVNASEEELVKVDKVGKKKSKKIKEIIEEEY